MTKLKLLAIILLLFISLLTFAATTQKNRININHALFSIEKSNDIKIGVYAIDTNSHKVIAYRANQRFPFQSTFKVIAVAALLSKSSTEKGLLNKTIHYSRHDLVYWHPVTGKHIDSGMTLRNLAQATIVFSDNPAINLIMKHIGGRTAITAFAHRIGNHTFQLTHLEPYLNSNPQHQFDSSTPKDMALTLQKLLLGHALHQKQRHQLLKWMRDNTTGRNRIRAGVPLGWVVADKTGSGSFGIANDIGMVWSPACKPIVLAIYTVSNKVNAKKKEIAIAKATKTILKAYAKVDYCFKATQLS